MQGSTGLFECLLMNETAFSRFNSSYVPVRWQYEQGKMYVNKKEREEGEREARKREREREINLQAEEYQ